MISSSTVTVYIVYQQCAGCSCHSSVDPLQLAAREPTSDEDEVSARTQAAREIMGQPTNINKAHCPTPRDSKLQILKSFYSGNNVW